MEEIDKWAAEQCGVGFTTNHKKQVVAWFTGSIDERVYWEFEWTIQDPRCREIVREHFKLETYLEVDGTWACSFDDQIM